MRRALHILTRPIEPLAEAIIRRQRAQPEMRVVVIRLDQPDPDYPALLEEIFKSDSVEVW
jgi:hypothetical protein